MTRRLIMHVGMPKTGTTTIQEYLRVHHAEFSAEGMGVLGRNGHSNGGQMGDWLVEMDGIHHLPGFFFGQRDAVGNHFPDWDGASARLISSEALYVVGPRGVAEVLRYATDNDATCEVVATVRNPVDWSWSRWTQWSKTEPLDWAQSVEQARSHREGFLSRTLDPWLDSGGVRKVTLVSCESPALVQRFLRAIGSSVQAEDPPSYNVGDDFITTLYRATLVWRIFGAHAHEARFAFADADRGFTQRMLMDLMDKADPCRQMGPYFEARVRQDPSIAAACIGTDSHEVVAAYAREWAADARSLIARSARAFDEESTRVVEDLVARAEEDADVLESGGPFRRPFPQRMHVLAMPINAQFVALARSLAMSILLGQQAWDGSFLFR